MNTQEDRLRRCDRCGARARVQVRIGNLELLFCHHHANEHDTVLATGRYPVAAV